MDWWNTEDLMEHIVESLRTGECEVQELKKIHVSNVAVELIPEKRLLHHMWEDNDLEGSRRAEELALWIQTHAPDQFVVIDTGDYIVPECCKSFDKDHQYCETYDADYHLYIVPALVWQEYEGAVWAKDVQWRTKMNSCQVNK